MSSGRGMPLKKEVGLKPKVEPIEPGIEVMKILIVFVVTFR
jgi:hypothetical protein